MTEPPEWTLEAGALTEVPGGAGFRCHLAGEELFYRAEGPPSASRHADALLAGLLLPAMRLGALLRLGPTLPISPRLLDGIARLQEIFAAWYPDLHRTTIAASPAAAQAGAPGAGSFFSAGLDSCDTLLRHQSEITHLILIRGVDLTLGNESGWQESLEAVQAVAAAYGKTLITVETNARFFARRIAGLSWLPYQGSGLASVGLLSGLGRIFIPSSNHYSALHPLGTHPLTDPLWSTEYTSFIHDGAALRRYQKLRGLAAHPLLLNHLRVCWQDAGYNCGRCDKCLHLRVALRLLGMNTPRMPPLTDLSELHAIAVHTVGEYAEWEDNLILAREVGDSKMERAVRRPLDRFLLRRGIRDLDQALMGGRLRRFFRGRR